MGNLDADYVILSALPPGELLFAAMSSKSLGYVSQPEVRCRMPQAYLE